MTDFQCRVTTSMLAFLLLAPVWARASDPPGYKEAEALVQQRQWDKGIAILRPLIRVHPDQPKLRNLLGLALDGKGQFKEANTQFGLALKTDPRFLPALKNLAITEFGLKDYPAAERHFKAALEQAPRDPVIHLYLGELAYRRQEYAMASKDFGQAGTLVFMSAPVTLHVVETYLESSQNEPALNLLSEMDRRGFDLKSQFRAGYLLAQHKLYSQAAHYFQAYRTRFPDSYDAGFNLAACLVEARNHLEAIEVLTSLRDGGHKTSEVLNLLGQAYEDKGQTQEAINVLREATISFPEDEENYFDLATICADHEAYKLALEVINVGLQYKPQSAKLISHRGVIYSLMGQTDRASEDLEIAHKLAPEENSHYAALGRMYMEKDNFPKAIQLLRQRTKENPKDYALLYILAEGLIRSGAVPGKPEFQEAQTDLEQCVRLNPDEADSRVALGKIYLKLHRMGEAIQQLEEARKIDATSKAACAQLAIAYRLQGDKQKADLMNSLVRELNDEDRKPKIKKLLKVEGE